jgi:hypothetical protein
MEERFNGRISAVLATTRFDSAQSLADTLGRYVRLYNHQIPQRALGHLSPVQALQDWQERCPELFKKKVYNHTGLDTLCLRGLDSANSSLPFLTPRKMRWPSKDRELDAIYRSGSIAFLVIKDTQ